MVPAKGETMKKTIIELDLIGYGDIARELEEHFSADIVIRFNDQIQTFITDALKVAGVEPQDTVMATTGDGAILMFDKPSVAHVFSEAVHYATRSHNHEKTITSAKRFFRVGIATGDLAIENSGGVKKMAGNVITRAVRLEAACNIGEILVDIETFTGLSNDQRVCYGAEEQIAGKRNEKFHARRYAVIPGLVVISTAKQSALISAKPTKAIEIWKQKLDFLQEQLAVVASPTQKFELKCQINEAREKIIELSS